MTQLVTLQEVVAIIGRSCPSCRAFAMERLACLRTVNAPSVLPGLSTVLENLCSTHEVAVADVLGPSRHSELIAVRREFTFAARAAGCSFPHIGRILHRHHATVINYLKKGKAVATHTDEV